MLQDLILEAREGRDQDRSHSIKAVEARWGGIPTCSHRHPWQRPVIYTTEVSVTGGTGAASLNPLTLSGPGECHLLPPPDFIEKRIPLPPHNIFHVAAEDRPKASGKFLSLPCLVRPLQKRPRCMIRACIKHASLRLAMTGPICTGREHRASAFQDRYSSKGTENQYCCVMG